MHCFSMLVLRSMTLSVAKPNSSTSEAPPLSASSPSAMPAQVRTHSDIQRMALLEWPRPSCSCMCFVLCPMEMVCRGGGGAIALAGEGVVKELCADASTRTPDNGHCLNLRGGARSFSSSLPPPLACA